MVINVHNGDPYITGFETAAGIHPKHRGCGEGGTCSTGTCGNGLEKVYPTAAIRYGYMRTVGEFRYPNRDMRFGCGANVIIQTNRGIEIGEMVSLTCDGCDKCVSRDKIKAYVEASGPEFYNFNTGRILRLATPEDEGDWAHIRAETLKKRKFCQERVNQVGLDMKILDAEHLFGGERIIFYFRSEARIDFRGLVKELADEYQTRIEMRQIGARDEARLLADYETCGRECCCKNFLKQLKPINMKMAKMQKATLDPAKVSGRCGRLKCCLRYEHVAYEELDRNLPRLGAHVFAPEGAGRVVDRQILTQLLQIETEDGGRFTVALEALLDPDEFAKRQAQQEKPASPERPRRTDRDDRGRPMQRVPRSPADPAAEAPPRPGADPDDRGRGRRGRRPRRGGPDGEQPAGAESPPTAGAEDVVGDLPPESTDQEASPNLLAAGDATDAPAIGQPDEPSPPEGSQGESRQGQARRGGGRRRRRGRRGPRRGGPPGAAGGPETSSGGG